MAIWELARGLRIRWYRYKGFVNISVPDTSEDEASLYRQLDLGRKDNS